MERDVLPKAATDVTTTGQEAVPTASEEVEFTFKRILVPIDFSEHSKKTVSCAVKFASRDNATIQLAARLSDI